MFLILSGPFGMLTRLARGAQHGEVAQREGDRVVPAQGQAAPWAPVASNATFSIRLLHTGHGTPACVVQLIIFFLD